MEVKIVSEEHNPMLKRREVNFQVENEQKGSTPSRAEIRKAVATALRTDESIVFVKKFETKTGTYVTTGVANVYETVERAKQIEPEYVVKRNLPEMAKEAKKE